MTHIETIASIAPRCAREKTNLTILHKSRKPDWRPSASVMTQTTNTATLKMLTCQKKILLIMSQRYCHRSFNNRRALFKRQILASKWFLKGWNCSLSIDISFKYPWYYHLVIFQHITQSRLYINTFMISIRKFCKISDKTLKGDWIGLPQLLLIYILFIWLVFDVIVRLTRQAIERSRGASDFPSAPSCRKQIV